MEPGSLRCRFSFGPRRRSATECVCRVVLLLATRDSWTGRGVAMAMRFRSGSLPRIPGVEDVVHTESAWHGGDRFDHFAHLRAGSPPGAPNHGYAGTGTARAGGIEHRLFSLPPG